MNRCPVCHEDVQTRTRDHVHAALEAIERISRRLHEVGFFNRGRVL